MPPEVRALTLAAVFAVAGGAAAQPMPPKPAAAPLCVACHGTDGVSTAPETPHLAAQPANYLVTQLKAFRSGARKHEVMNVVAKPLSDADIDALAAWYAAFRIEAKAP